MPVRNCKAPGPDYEPTDSSAVHLPSVRVASQSALGCIMAGQRLDFSFLLAVGSEALLMNLPALV